jgi:hypothetical protein
MIKTSITSNKDCSESVIMRENTQINSFSGITVEIENNAGVKDEKHQSMNS